MTDKHLTEKAQVHEPRCNTYCTPGSHHLTSGIGYPHLHRTDLAGECGECGASGPPIVDCGSNAADWCLAPSGTTCTQHDQNGDRRG